MAFPTTGLLRDFSGTTGTTPPTGCTNTLVSGSQGMQINSNAVSRNAGGAGSIYLTGLATAADCEAAAFMVTAPGAPDTNSGGVLARVVNPGTTSAGGYLCMRRNSTQVSLYRLQAGNVFINLVNFTKSMTAGDGLGIACKGAILEAWVYESDTSTWSQLGTYDTTPDSIKYTSGGYLGLYEEDFSTRWDNYLGGDIVSGPGTTALNGALSSTHSSSVGTLNLGLLGISGFSISTSQTFAGIQSHDPGIPVVTPTDPVYLRVRRSDFRHRRRNF